jgi:hypothetical protein
MDTINHPLTSMEAVRQVEKERQRSPSPSHLPHGRSRTNSSFSSSSPSLAGTECSAGTSSISSVGDDARLKSGGESSSMHSRGGASAGTASSFHTAEQEHPDDEADESQIPDLLQGAMSIKYRPPSPSNAAPTRPQAVHVRLQRVGSDLSKSSQLSVPLERISSSDRRWLEDYIDHDDDESTQFTQTLAAHTDTAKTSQEGNPSQAAAPSTAAESTRAHTPGYDAHLAPVSPQRSILSVGSSSLHGLDVLSTTMSTTLSNLTASSNANSILPPLISPSLPTISRSSTPTPSTSSNADSSSPSTNRHNLNLREQMEAARKAQERMRDAIDGRSGSDDDAYDTPTITATLVASHERRVVSPERTPTTAAGTDQHLYGMGDDPLSRFLRSQCRKEATNVNDHYISDTDDDDDDDDEDNPAIIATNSKTCQNNNISTDTATARNNPDGRVNSNAAFRTINRQFSMEEQEVARMTAQLGTQCDLYQKQISQSSLLDGRRSVASGTSASIPSSIRHNAAPGRGDQTPPRATNLVRIHVYDLLTKDAEIELNVLSLGCHVNIGQCFATMNDGLHALGSGAYHVGVEVNGLEYAYGANDVPFLSGVFTCPPRMSPGYQYRTTIDFGERTVDISDGSQRHLPSSGARDDGHVHDGDQMMRGMAREYLGLDYDLLRRNCCTFARDACLRLGVSEDEIPSWFLHLANTGAVAHDAVAKVEDAVDRGVEPLKRMLSLENSSSEGRRRRRDRQRTGRKDSGKESTAPDGCGRVTDESTIDSVVNAIGRSLCFGPQMLTNSCAT